MNLADDNSTLTLWLNVLLLVCRYVHIVSSMLLVGGILFFEMVVPSAIGDLNDQQQMAIFAKARLVFRWIARTSITLLILTGVYLTFRRMHLYIESEFPAVFTGRSTGPVPWPLKTGVWWAAHVMAGVAAMVFAVYLVAGDRPPRHPIGLLRLDMMVLLIVVFFASVTHQVDQIHQDRLQRLARSGYLGYSRPNYSSDDEDAAGPSTAPSRAPATQEAP